MQGNAESAAINALHQVGEHAAEARLDERVGPGRGERLDALLEAHGAREVANQVLARVGGGKRRGGKLFA